MPLTRFLQKFDQLSKLSLGGELGGASIIGKYAELIAPTQKRDLYLFTFHPCQSVYQAASRLHWGCSKLAHSWVTRENNTVRYMWILGWGPNNLQISPHRCSRLSTLNYVNRWTQQLDGLYALRYFFWTWHCQHALVTTMHILPMQSESNMCNLVNIY
jgi:hypothetical protein